MSRCQIVIDFYRPDREYRTGNVVHGWVRVTVNKNLKCRALHLNVFWRTHGRGNTARKNYHQETLFQGDWQVGQTYEYPFEFTPPLAPLTYHGRYLNIDHYVSARADIPWAVDPRSEEEFFWRVGNVESEPGAMQPVLEPDHGCGTKIGIGVAALVAIFSVITAITINPLLLGLLLLSALILFLSFRSRLAEQKLGEVKWGTLSSCYAGETMPSLLQIGPLGNVRIRQITAEVRGIESVVSGSGTDATTYSHLLHESKQVLLDSPVTKRGELIEVEPVIQFPDTSALSVDLPDNKIVWHATVAIRIAGWPDWVQSREIILIGRPASESSANPNPVADTRTLQELVQTLSGFARSGMNRKQIEKLLMLVSGDIFEVSVVINEIEATDSMQSDPDYSNGRSIKGTLSGSSFSTTLAFPNCYNLEVAKLNPAQIWNGIGTVVDWDPVQKNAVLLVVQ